ncbi:hypothetical protein MYCFIDRAFT_201874 [Lecanosticta acicola]|uniref:Uncharacterized protein n=1 Tax=Lecanosticta acicola TaxID=111012 RepID=A0AAI9E8D7_9PEZI|nr:hypothetical protein MYCFIDRAFT_201874 [Lecanosticta acicola]
MASYSQSYTGYADFCHLVDSWVEVSSQPSSSSLSSVADEIVTTGLRVQEASRARRRKTGAPTHLNITRTQSAGGTSSQEEYEESESESDRIMTSSGEGPMMAALVPRANNRVDPNQPQQASDQMSDDDDENKTAVNHPLRHEECFTPQPNAFTHPPAGRPRNASQTVPGSYFPASRPGPPSRPSTRHSVPMAAETRRPSHLPQNPLSPCFNAAAEHEEALRASLTGLLSVAAAARGLSKPNIKRPNDTTAAPRTGRVDPMSFRIVPESALPTTSPQQLQEPTFKPTIRRTSTNSTSTTSEQQQQQHKRKALTTPARNSSRERSRALKKARRSASSTSNYEDLYVTPTLLTWVVSAGVVVFLSALSFGAGYSMGKEAGRLEAGGGGAFGGTDEQLRLCAREAGRSGMGLKRSLARGAIQV